MRSNYEEVNEATALTLTLTKKGDDKLDEIDSVGDESLWIEPQVDAMLAIQNDYYALENGAEMEIWHQEFLRQYKENFGAESHLTYEDFVDLFKKGYVSVQKVIWDD